jgi:hypothetical protein
MDPNMLYALRDPAGLPFYPVVFLLLGVLTFALHIFAVQVMLGASSLVITGAFRADPHWRRLASAMTDTAKIAVSVAIVIGVAPLLFVQVIYDPFWYTSSVLSAQWVIGFIVIMIVAYLSLYLYYFRNYHVDATRPPRTRWAMLVSLALFLVAGFLMHVFTSQMLHPDQWMQWYAPGGELDTSGSSVHAYNLWRFGFFILTAVPVIGAWLFGYARYLSGKAGADRDYLAFVNRLGTRLMLVGVPLVVLFGGLWMATIPKSAGAFATSAWVWMALAALVAGYIAAYLTRGDAVRGGYLPLLVMLVVGVVVAAAREALRYVILNGAHGYNFMDYPVNMDWYSTILFFGTFAVVGGSVLAYLLTVAWQAGRTEGVYTPGPAVQRMGKVSVALIALWIVQYFVIGFIVWAA